MAAGETCQPIIPYLIYKDKAVKQILFCQPDFWKLINNSCSRKSFLQYKRARLVFKNKGKESQSFEICLSELVKLLTSKCILLVKSN